MFPFLLKNHFKNKTKSPLLTDVSLLSLLTFPQLCAVLQLQGASVQLIQVHVKEMNQDHTDEIMSSGEVYFDDNIEFPRENHQRSLKSEQNQVKAAADAVI